MGRPATLLTLADAIGEQRIVSNQFLGLQVAPIQRIRGSEGRAADFDPEFRPLRGHIRERWVSIAHARLHDQPLPPVDLVQVGEWYYVRDGHHRISVARAEGQIEIDAVVLRWQLAAEEQPLSAPSAFRLGHVQRFSQWVVAVCGALLRPQPA